MNSVHLLVFVMEMKYVYCEVGNQFLNVIYTNIMAQRLQLHPACPCTYQTAASPHYCKKKPL